MLWENKSESVVIEIIEEMEKFGKSFPGLYLLQFCERAWTSDNYFVFSSVGYYKMVKRKI